MLDKHKTIMDNVKIVSIGTYIPTNRISNIAKAERFGDDKSFVEKIGFISLARKSKDETIIDLCINAYKDLAEKTDVNLKDIQLLTLVTQNPHYKIPHTSAIIHNLLEVDKNCMTFDISQGCSGYTHALEIVKSLMESLRLNNALIFTCDSYGEIIDEEDRNVSMLFGDGATVTLLSRENDGYLIKDSDFGTLPNSYDCLICNDILKMDGRRVFNYASNEVPKSIELLLNRNKLSKKDVDVFILHQASKFIVDYLKRLLEVDLNKIEFSASDFGNTVSSSIPIQLSQLFNENYKKYVVLSGFGVGFTWGNCLLEYSKQD